MLTVATAARVNRRLRALFRKCHFFCILTRGRLESSFSSCEARGFVDGSILERFDDFFFD